MRRLLIVLASAPLVAAMAQPPAPPKLELGPPVRFAFAGVQAAMPLSLQPLPLEDPFDVFRYTRLEKDEAVLAVSLSAWPTPEKTALAEFIEAAQPKSDSGIKPKNLALRNVKILKSEPLRVAGVDGEIRIMTYSFRGIDTTAVRLFFMRPAPNASMKIGYALTVESARKYGKELMPTLSAVAKSLELFDPVSPSSERIELATQPLVRTKFGFSIRPPLLWKVVSSGPSETLFFQTDYLRRGMPVPTATVLSMPNIDTAQQASRKMMEVLADSLKRQKREIRGLREGEAKLGGMLGYEIVAKEEPLAGQPASQTLIAVDRTIVSEGMSYSIMLVYQTDKVEDVVAAMEALAGGFALLKPASSGPTSAPTSGPGTFPATVPSATTPPARQPAGHGTPAVPGGDAVPSPAAIPILPSTTVPASPTTAPALPSGTSALPD